MKNSFLIAAPSSNSGKTTVTLGLLRYFRNKGLKVQPFKCGPDYIDTIHHTNAARKESINLDLIMMSETHVKEVFSTYSDSADISIIEGVMGLFDGAVKDKGSSAHVAKTLGVPVILVINAKAMAYSVAPILYGLKHFDPAVTIAGVIFNFVRTESHYAFLKEACAEVGVSSLGYIPPNDQIEIPSRHLGLHIDADFEEMFEKAASHVSAHVAIEKLVQLSKRSTKGTIQNKPLIKSSLKKIAVAKDAAFTFTYAENLRYLESIGEVVYFSPLQDDQLPDVDMIYLAGGYPELYLSKLSANKSMLASIKKAADDGVQILAECGGMMYLGKNILAEEGTVYEMANVFPYSTSMEQKKLRLGYRKVVFDSYELWGHEFHYSKVLNDTTIATKYKVYTAREKEIDTKLYTYKNVLSSYIHFYWGEGLFSWLYNKLPNLNN